MLKWSPKTPHTQFLCRVQFYKLPLKTHRVLLNFAESPGERCEVCTSEVRNWNWSALLVPSFRVIWNDFLIF
jgi:hypothetical protein